MTDPPKTGESTASSGAGCVELNNESCEPLGEFWPLVPVPGLRRAGNLVRLRSALLAGRRARLAGGAGLRACRLILINPPEKLAGEPGSASRQLSRECGRDSHLLQSVVMDAADELSAAGHIDEPPAAVRLVHRLLIGLAEEMDARGIGFGEVFETRGVLAVLLVVKANGSNILIAAPNRLLLAQPAALGKHIGGGDGCE